MIRSPLGSPGEKPIEASALAEAFDGVAPVTELGEANSSDRLDITVNDETLQYDAAEIGDLRSVIEDELA